jgi:hypothetical protein
MTILHKHASLGLHTTKAASNSNLLPESLSISARPKAKQATSAHIHPHPVRKLFGSPGRATYNTGRMGNLQPTVSIEPVSQPYMPGMHKNGVVKQFNKPSTA